MATTPLNQFLEIDTSLTQGNFPIFLATDCGFTRASCWPISIWLLFSISPCTAVVGAPAISTLFTLKIEDHPKKYAKTMTSTPAMTNGGERSFRLRADISGRREFRIVVQDLEQ